MAIVSNLLSCAIIALCYPLVVVWRILVWFSNNDHVLLSRLRRLREANNARQDQSKTNAAQIQQLKRSLKNATSYEEWIAAGTRLDDVMEAHYSWKHNNASRLYDYKYIQRLVNELQEGDQTGDILSFRFKLQRSIGRNLAGIANPQLYTQLYAGTKAVIEDYVKLVVDRIDYVIRYGDVSKSKDVTKQWKMEFVEHSRRNLGRTALVLEGGGIFAFYHVGVMRELYRHGLLPNVILGSSTGAYLAGLAAVCTDDELCELLSDSGLNLDILSADCDRDAKKAEPELEWKLLFWTRMKSLSKTVYASHDRFWFRLMEAHVGDMTFQEAFNRTHRMVSTSIPCDSLVAPSCLNYITTPNVLVRTAVIASQASDMDLAACLILEKSHHGEIRGWSLIPDIPLVQLQRHQRQRDQVMPRSSSGNIKSMGMASMRRVSQLWAVNHFVFSQPRPHILPLVRSEFFNRSQLLDDFPWLQVRLTRFMLWFWRRTWRFLPNSLQSLFSEPKTPGLKVLIAPDCGFEELENLVSSPSRETLEQWIAVGEKATWPYIPALRIRCDVELALEEHYQSLRGQIT